MHEDDNVHGHEQPVAPIPEIAYVLDEVTHTAVIYEVPGLRVRDRCFES